MKKLLTVTLIVILALLLSGFNCKSIFNPTKKQPAPTAGTIVFENQTGQRLRGYINGTFMSFIEIGQTRNYEKNPIGRYELKADNFSSGEWVSDQFDLTAGMTYTWTIL